MKFRTRMIMVYSVFILSAAVLLGGVFYYSSVRRSVNQELQNLEDISRQLIQQYEESAKAMKNVCHYVLSDVDALDAIRKLSVFPKDADYVSLYFSEAARAVRNLLNTDYIISNFYRVIFFNRNGVVVSTIHEKRKMDPSAGIDGLPWFGEMDSVGYGEFAVIGLHVDDWGEKKQNVYSVIKEIQGDNLGYIEVQRTEDSLKALLEVSNPEIKVLLFDKQGKLLFSNGRYDGDLGYEEFLAQGDASAGRYRNTVTGDEEFLAGSLSAETGVTIIVAERYDAVKSDLHYIFTITLLLAASFIAIAILYTVAASSHLAKPVQELAALMERTKLNNITENVELKTSNNEIEQLRQSYENMLKRLDSAILKEKRTSMIQLQAQFDALQAQVNPHFIYNILNVISSRGVLNNDEVICDICDGLAAMLRYSTNTKERYATVEKEADYVEAYIKLLKCRYEHKLEYHMDIQPEIRNYILPKLVLQQLVENSISHGYENGYEIMRLEISGWQDQEGWYIRIRDNGDGFSEESLKYVRDEIMKLRLQISSIQRNVELEIGGMGNANTYARLYLLYSEQLIYRVGNHEQGAEVFLGIRKSKEGEL